MLSSSSTMHGPSKASPRRGLSRSSTGVARKPCPSKCTWRSRAASGSRSAPACTSEPRSGLPRCPRAVDAQRRGLDRRLGVRVAVLAQVLVVERGDSAREAPLADLGQRHGDGMELAHVADVDGVLDRDLGGLHALAREIADDPFLHLAVDAGGFGEVDLAVALDVAPTRSRRADRRRAGPSRW